MKVLMFMGGAEEGGLEKHFVELANGLAERCELIAVGHAKYQSRFVAEVNYQPLDLSRSRRNPLMLWQLVRLIRQHQPEIIHAQGGKAASILASLTGYLKGVRIATVHGLKKKAGFYRKLDHCICVSQGAASQLGLTKYSIIYNGLKTPSPNPPHAFVRREDIHVLAVGRLVPEKGFDLLLEAWQQVDARLAIAGDGPLRQSLQQQIHQLKLDQRVTLLGHRDDVPQLIADSHLLVISSRREGFSYVFAEGLLAGRPVLVTDVPVANEVLPPEVLIPRDNPQALAEAVNRALDDLDGCYRQYQPWFAFARLQFSRQAMIDKTLGLYGRLLQEGS